MSTPSSQKLEIKLEDRTTLSRMASFESTTRSNLSSCPVRLFWFIMCDLQPWCLIIWLMLTHNHMQKSALFTVNSRSYSKCTSIGLVFTVSNSMGLEKSSLNEVISKTNEHSQTVNRLWQWCCIVYSHNAQMCITALLIWKLVYLHATSEEGTIQNTWLTSVRGYLLDFHRIPGSLWNYDKNHIHLRFGANRQMLLWQIPQCPIHTEEERWVKVKTDLFKCQINEILNITVFTLE